MAYNVGLNVVEVDGKGAPSIVGAAASVGAFNIQTRRGVPNRPARITNYPQFAQQFGGFFAGALGAYLVKGFFDNGGQTAYVNRVVATDPATGAGAAGLTLQDSAAIPLNTLTLSAGFRGTADPGGWGNDLYVKVEPANIPGVHVMETAPATVQGSALVEPVDMSAFPTLSVIIDGEASATVFTFQASDFAPNPAQVPRVQIRDAINRRTSKLIASISGDGRLVLTSTGASARLSKSWTSLQVSAVNATLGYPVAAVTPTTGTPAARSTTGTRLASVQALQVGDAVRVTDGATTALVKITSITPTTGDVTWTPAIAGIAGFDPLLLTVSPVEFNLTVAYGGNQPENVVETWKALSMEPDVPNYATTILNDTIQGSAYLTAADAHSASGPGLRVPGTLSFTRFTPGRDGTPTSNDFTGDPTAHTGFYAFDSYTVQLVCCERSDPPIVAAGLTYCANRGDCMYIGSVPQSFSENQAVAYGQAFQAKKVYGALYYPWIKILDPNGTGNNPFKWIPPTGHVMGVYARVESNRGIWKAPAGDEASVMGALDVEYRLSDAEHTDLVKNGSVNGVRAVPRAGIVVDSSRTLSTDTRWLYVNVRLLFNYVKSSLKLGLSWVRQEPNRDTLWNVVKFGSVTPFLMGLWKQGAFGTGTPEQVFTVICDATNNPPDQVDQGNFKLEVYFYPSKPAETIIIIVGQQPSGATTGEA